MLGAPFLQCPLCAAFQTCRIESFRRRDPAAVCFREDRSQDLALAERHLNHLAEKAGVADIIPPGLHGRVLGVTALGSGIQAAIQNAYAAVGDLRFEGMHYRKDIGRKALARL